MTEQADATGRIMDRIGRSWRSAMRDVFLIVVSILIAFGLDAWWSGRVALEEEQHALSAIQADFGAARIELDSVLLLNAAGARAITALLSLDAAGIRRLGHDSASAMVTRIMSGGLTFDPSMGALQALLSTGTLGQVRRRELAAELSAWPGALGEISADQRFLVDTWVDLRDWAGERGLLTSVLALWGFPSLNAEATPQEILLELTVSGRGLLAAQLLSLSGLHMELQDVDRRLSTILELLSAELGEN